MLEGTLTVIVEREEYELGPVRRDPRRAARCAGSSSTAARSACCCSRSAARREHQGRDGEAFASWDDPGGRPPADVPLPPDLNL